MDFKSWTQEWLSCYIWPINLSILDFKNYVRRYSLLDRDAINLSILDFKTEQNYDRHGAKRL